MKVWVVVYDSHSGHQITVHDNEDDAKADEREIEEDGINGDFDRTSDWISCEQHTVFEDESYEAPARLVDDLKFRFSGLVNGVTEVNGADLVEWLTQQIRERDL